MKNNELYNELIEKYGDLQVIVAIEELGELQKELCKSLRDKGNRDKIIEEIADVCIMVDQLKIMYGISTAVIHAAKNKKLLRTKERLESNNL